MIFDEFFTDLSMFQHHVDSGLITIDDIRPYLEYWVKAMCGHGPIHSNRVASRIDSFLKAFNYDAVLRLFAAIGCSLEAIECTIDPEIRKADRDLFQFITKKAAAWKGTIQRTEKSKIATPIFFLASRKYVFRSIKGHTLSDRKLMDRI